jgi:transposase
MERELPKMNGFPSKEEFTKLYVEYNNEELMEILGVTKSQLRYRVERLGLNKNPNIKRKGRTKNYKGPTREKIKELAANYTAKEIASMYGVAHVTAQSWCSDAGVVKKRRFEPEQSLFFTHTLREIAEIYDVDVAIVHRYRKKHNLPSLKKYMHKLPEDNNILLELLQSHTKLEIAQMYDVSTAAIDSRLIRMKKKQKELS